MKIKAMLLATALVLASVITAMALAQPNTTDAAGGMNDNGRIRARTVALKCVNTGSQQDVAKTPWITNTTGKTLPKGHKVYWKSSDGDQGVIELDNALKSGDSVKGLGHPGQSYTCTASTPMSIF